MKKEVCLGKEAESNAAKVFFFCWNELRHISRDRSTTREIDLITV